MNFMENDSNCTMENLVFLSKVFFDNTASSCPVITPIVTNDRNFSQQLIIGDRERDCDCDCDCEVVSELLLPLPALLFPHAVKDRQSAKTAAVPKSFFIFGFPFALKRI